MTKVSRVADIPENTARLEQILLRNRETLGVEVPEGLLLEIAEIEEQNQFDDDRRKARDSIRAVVTSTGKEIRLAEVSTA